MTEKQPLFNRLVNWALNIILTGCTLLIVWLLLVVTTFSSFKVPTGSMESVILPGDYILVNKWLAGARIFDVWKSVEGEEVEISRLSGTRKIKRNDVLVFNDPYCRSADSISMDVMRYHVKRCVALPGDTFEIRQGINRVKGFDGVLGDVERQRLLPRTFMPIEGWEAKGVYPQDSLFKWTLLEFGPLYLPAKGDEMELSAHHYKLYKHLIEWEQKGKLALRGDSVFLNDSLVRNYCFRENYYFMAGDRVTSSRDSRYWGLLPESYIVGIATLIWKSEDMETGKIRWNRVLKSIR